jgi:peptide/nickel transport system substrate-binding protein
LKQGVFKYIFVLGFIILLIITYVVFYDKDSSINEVQDQTSTTSTLITDLRIGIAEYDTMNPIISKNKNVKEISRLIFDSLISVTNNYGIEYGLATEIAKSDNLTYIIKLREGVKWQDGTDFTAQDVAFTFDTIKNKNTASTVDSSYASNLQYVTQLEIIDSYTIKISLTQEVEFFEYNLTMPIISSNYFNGEDVVNSEKNKNIIGTGMFQISEVGDGLIKLEPNSNYWNKDKTPILTEIDINLYSNIGDMYSAFKSGYIDIMDVTVSNIETYIGSIGYTKVDYAEREVNFLSFNIQNDLFLDSKTRKAIALYLDKNNILANLGSGYMISNFVIPQNSWIYDNRLDGISDVSGDSLLTEAGWSYMNNKWVNGEGKVLGFTITVDSSKSDRVTAANVIASQLENHGISVTVKEESGSTYENDYNNKNYEVLLSGIKTGYSPKLTSLFSENNLANYNSETVTSIMNDIRNTVDYSVQQENYKKLYNEYLNDYPYIFLYRQTDSIVYNQTLCGKITPNSYSIFYNIEKWYRQ